MREEVIKIAYGFVKIVNRTEKVPDDQIKTSKEVYCCGVKVFEKSIIRPKGMADAIRQVWGFEKG